MAACSICGSDNPDGSNFCEGCGNNLQETTHVVSQQQYSAPVQYQPVDFKVEQKIFALRATYKVKNSFDQEFMVVRKKFFSMFRPHLFVQHADGSPFGHIQANLWKTEWKIYDAENNLYATIRFPLFMFFRKNFSIETADGIFQSGNSIFAYKFDAYDSKGQISFLVDKKIFSIRDSFQIKNFGQLSPFIVCLVAVTIDQRFHSKGGSDRSFAFD